LLNVVGIAASRWAIHHFLSAVYHTDRAPELTAPETIDAQLQNVLRFRIRGKFPELSKGKGKGKGRILFLALLTAAIPRPAALYNRRKWQLIGKSQWCGSANAAATTHTTAPINHNRPSPRKHSPDGADTLIRVHIILSYYLCLRLVPFLRYSEILVKKSPMLTYPSCVWRLRWSDAV